MDFKASDEDKSHRKLWCLHHNISCIYLSIKKEKEREKSRWIPIMHSGLDGCAAN